MSFVRSYVKLEAELIKGGEIVRWGVVRELGHQSSILYSSTVPSVECGLRDAE